MYVIVVNINKFCKLTFGSQGILLVTKELQNKSGKWYNFPRI